jgi:hypothetical protein
MFSDKIRKTAAQKVEAPLPHVAIARWLNLKGCEPVKHMMRVDCGDRRDIVFFASANDNVADWRLWAHLSLSFRSDDLSAKRVSRSPV